MMDEILLTHDQQGDAIDTALARCTRDKELSPVHTVAEEVSRAQVKKVYKFILTHWQSAKKLDGAVQLTISEADWAALKAAGGEEK